MAARHGRVKPAFSIMSLMPPWNCRTKEETAVGLTPSHGPTAAEALVVLCFTCSEPMDDYDGVPCFPICDECLQRIEDDLLS